MGSRAGAGGPGSCGVSMGDAELGNANAWQGHVSPPAGGTSRAQPGHFEAHRKQDKRETCFLRQEHNKTNQLPSKMGLSSSHSKQSPFPHSAAEASAEHLCLKH